MEFLIKQTGELICESILCVNRKQIVHLASVSGSIPLGNISLREQSLLTLT
jgi:hypothetical protein